MSRDQATALQSQRQWDSISKNKKEKKNETTIQGKVKLPTEGSTIIAEDLNPVMPRTSPNSERCS